jgi:hypothetical protein
VPTTAKVARAREVGRSRGRKRRDMAVGGGGEGNRRKRCVVVRGKGEEVRQERQGRWVNDEREGRCVCSPSRERDRSLGAIPKLRER